MMAVNLGTARDPGGGRPGRVLQPARRHALVGPAPDARPARRRTTSGCGAWATRWTAPGRSGTRPPTEYGRLAAEAGKAMKLVDPTIELVACGSSNHTMPTFGYWESEVLEHAWDVVDHVSMHAYYEEVDGDRRSFLGLRRRHGLRSSTGSSPPSTPSRPASTATRRSASRSTSGTSGTRSRFNAEGLPRITEAGAAARGRLRRARRGGGRRPADLPAQPRRPGADRVPGPAGQRHRPDQDRAGRRGLAAADVPPLRRRRRRGPGRRARPRRGLRHRRRPSATATSRPSPPPPPSTRTRARGASSSPTVRRSRPRSTSSSAGSPRPACRPRAPSRPMLPRVPTPCSPQRRSPRAPATRSRSSCRRSPGRSSKRARTSFADRAHRRPGRPMSHRRAPPAACTSAAATPAWRSAWTPPSSRASSTGDRIWATSRSSTCPTSSARWRCRPTTGRSTSTRGRPCCRSRPVAGWAVRVCWAAAPARPGRSPSTRWTTRSPSQPTAPGSPASRLDEPAGVEVTTEIELFGNGLLRLRACVRNLAETPYEVTLLEPALPVPAEADELLDMAGRHAHERTPQRHAFTQGSTSARPGAAVPATTRPPCCVPAGPGSASAPVGSGVSTSAGAATRCSAPRTPSPAGSCCAEASSSCPARWCWATTRPMPRPGSTPPGARGSMPSPAASTST